MFSLKINWRRVFVMLVGSFMFSLVADFGCFLASLCFYFIDQRDFNFVLATYIECSIFIACVSIAFGIMSCIKYEKSNSLVSSSKPRLHSEKSVISSNQNIIDLDYELLD